MADSPDKDRQAEIFKALADKTRLQILEHAVNGPVSAPDLESEIETSNESINYHLKELEHIGLLESSTVRGPGNRPRKEYRLAGNGRRIRLEIIENDYDFEFREPHVI